MLKALPSLPDAVISAAGRMARSCFDAEGDSRPIRIVHEPIGTYVAAGFELADLSPTKLVRAGFDMAIVDCDWKVVGWTAMAERKGRLKPVSFTFVERDSPDTLALDMVDASLGRPGDHELRTIRVFWLGASFFWITGDGHQFVDRLRAQVYDEAGFVAKMRRRHEQWLPPLRQG